MVNSSSRLNYFFLHKLGFKVEGLNGVYSEDLNEVSPATGNNLRSFNDKDLEVDYSMIRNTEAMVLDDPEAVVKYQINYNHSDDTTSLILELSGDEIAVILDDEVENGSNSVLRDLRWAFDRLEADENVDCGSFDLKEYSEGKGQMVVEQEY